MSFSAETNRASADLGAALPAGGQPAPQAEKPVLSVSSLRVAYERNRASTEVVRGVSLELHAGETLGLVGESGCGKSALALAIASLLPSNGHVMAGTVDIGGTDLAAMSERDRRPHRGKTIGFVFQESLAALNPLLTIGRQITEATELHLGLRGADAQQRAIDLLSEVGVPDPARRLSQYPHQLSGGLRQRVVVAIALSADPQILIADEPTTALDVTVQAQLLDLLRREQRTRRMAVLLITHDLGVVAHLADRLAIMYAGRIVEEGPTEDLFRAPRHPYTIGLLRSVPRLDDDPDRDLEAIAGQPPALASLASGCPFVPRCPLAQPRCHTDEPDLLPTPGGRHRVACWEA